MSDFPAGYSGIRPLGRGAFGEVYAATDATGRAVALKLMAAEAAARPEAVWQFLGEHRRLARLDHPAFPAAGEAGTSPDGRPFYAMALAEGAEPTGTHEPAEVRRLLVAVAEALAYLHGLGQVHGDLKAENLRVAPDGHLWVLDVGLMAPTGQRREAVAGTPTHMAPEVLRRAPVAPGADLYALGVLGYELWTGRPPFSGGPGDLARAHLQAPPPPLPGSDPELAALLQGLLAKDAGQRPPSALAVLAALGQPVDPALLAGPAAGLQGGELVGRADVLAAWQAVLAARTGWLAFGGAAGEGKSRLLDELRLAAQVAGLAWVGAACTGGAPGAPVRAAVRQALAAAGLEPEGAAQAWLAGELTPALADMEPAARKVTLHAAAAAALSAAAERLGGLAIGLDDWHLADQASRDFLDFLRRSGDSPAVAWAIAFDPEQSPALPVDLAPLALGPFTATEAARHVANRLGGDAPAPLMEALAGAARGNPLLLDLALEHLVARGALRREPSGWRYDADAAARAGLPAGLADAWRARHERLAPPARRLAAAAALAAPAGALPVLWLSSAAGVAGVELEAALAQLAAEGVVAVEGGLARFLAGGAEALFTAELDARTRATWTTGWAWELLGLDSGLSGHTGTADRNLLDALQAANYDALARAAVLVLAVDTPLAPVLAAEAGRRALAMAAPAEALRFLSAAEERWPPEGPAMGRLAIALPKAEAARFLDQLPAAAEAYEKAIALATEAGDPRAEAAALVGLAKVRQMQGAGAAAAEHYEAADARAAACGDDAQRARAQAALARVRLFAGEPAAGASLAEGAAKLAQTAGNRSLRSQALTLLGYIRVTTDPQDAATGFAQLDEALALAREVGDRVAEGMALDNVGNVRLALGDLQEATAAFRAAGALARANGTATEALFADLNLALALAEQGAAEAGPLAQDVVRRAEAAGRKYVLGAAHSIAAQAAWRAGRIAEAASQLDQALETAQAIKHLMLEEHVRLYRLEAQLARGDRAAAREEAALLAEIVAKTAHAEAAARLATLQAELALQEGDTDRARELAGPLAAAPNRVAAHQALGILARAAADADEALDHAEAARAIARDWQSPWHEAADLLQMARAVKAADPGTARTWAQEALALATDNPYAAAGAALLLRELGTAVDVPVPAGWQDLDLAPLVEVWDLAGLDVRPPAPPQAGLDPILYAACMEELALATDEAAIGQAALEGAMALVGAHRGYVLGYEDGRLRQVVTVGASFAEVEGGFSNSIAEEVLFSSRPVYVSDASSDPNWREAASVVALNLRTVVCLPLAVPDRILGVLYMDREDLEPLIGQGDLALLGAFATAAAALIVRERDRRAEATRAELAHRCAELGAKLAPEDPAAVRAATLAAAVAATGADRAFWLDADGAALAATGPFDPASVSRGIVDWVASSRQPLGLLDASNTEEWQGRGSVQALGLRTVWCVPAGAAGVVYLDAARMVEADPGDGLRAVEALVGFASKLMS